MVHEPEAGRSGEALLLEAALQTIPFGFCVWSPDFSLLLWNQRYLDIYGFPRATIVRGMNLRDVVALSCRMGNHPDLDPDVFFASYRQQLLSNRAGLRAISHELAAGGRTLETAHVYAQGLGWVVTHEDVTEEIARSDMLAERKRELELQYALVDATINNISHGVSMFDAQFRLVTCNRAFREMYGLSEEMGARGTAYATIIDHRIATGRHAPVDRDDFLAERRAIMAGGRFVREVIKTASGTYLSLRHQPLRGGGVVTTHEDITEQLAAEARMRHMATHDALTDLPNRALFREEIEKALAGPAAGRSFCLLSINLDNFKAINDADGHSLGDRVLVEAGQRLSQLIGAEGMVARLGGDEFAVLLTEGNPRRAADVARRAVKVLSKPYMFGARSAVLSASVGIAVAPGDGQSADALMNNADLALLRAKSEGRATYNFFEAGMDASLQRRRLLETGLRDAVERGELSLVFQPLIALATDTIVGAEALLRWSHPTLGAIAPSEFITVAEDTGAIHDIGAWVLLEATRTAAEWPAPLQVAVNLSPLQFKRPGLVEAVRSALSSSGLAPERLELEITESLLLDNSIANIETLFALRALGTRVAMDDFGTGYSSLSYLRAFPFDKIKIDRAFMGDIASRPESRAIVKAMIGLGTSLGMTTVAEGVETAEQLAVVRAEGCTQVQGFFHSPPVGASEISAMIRAGRRVQAANLTRAG
ncbi:putative bifunctional diguanylate cyclase/phosphodiesterase [Pelagibacterium montanilacus]|uniref:putative bifunctional diguanylate cyclase/phosphodiesterase n=1 Tax=Pelagibacterium montanilacus TaxID=2185280 RepID=UPI001FE64413|nr:EAL domain-containing protein [Pelagibacterium montanilacus]